MHIITTHTGKQIQTKWGTLAQFYYTELRKTDLKGFFEDMASMALKIEVVATLIQAGTKYAGHGVSFEEACEIIDDCGGMLAKDGPLHDYVNYVIGKTTVNVTTEEEEKKSEPQNA